MDQVDALSPAVPGQASDEAKIERAPAPKFHHLDALTGQGVGQVAAAVHARHAGPETAGARAAGHFVDEPLQAAHVETQDEVEDANDLPRMAWRGANETILRPGESRGPGCPPRASRAGHRPSRPTRRR